MRARRLALRCALIGGVALAALAGALVWRFGTPGLALAWLRGERLVLSPAEADLGECQPRTEHVARFTLANLTDRPVRVVGGEQSCACVALDELPVEVAARGSGEISVQFFVAGEGLYAQQLLLYIDDDGELKTVSARVTARIRQEGPAPGGATPPD